MLVSAVYWCHQEREGDQDDTQRTPRDAETAQRISGEPAWANCHAVSDSDM